jgi:hypothetical protein
MRKTLKRLFLAGIVAGIGYAVWRAVKARIPPPAVGDVSWETAPFPFPPAPRPGERAPSAAGTNDPWVEPIDGACPATHPVKAKLSSGIYHVLGGQNYDRTHADRCYLDADAAEADGLRRSQR